MIQSMTGFASAKGAHGAHSWSWELRSVNGKGLDLRLRVPDWLEGLETALRARLGKALSRGNVTLSLRLSRLEEGGDLALNAANAEAILGALQRVEAAAAARGLVLAPSTAAEVLAQRGVLETASAEADVAALVKVLEQGFEPLLADYLEMRQREGAALAEVLSAQIDEIADLTAQAAKVDAARAEHRSEVLRGNLAKVLDNTDGADADRVAQELALIAVKADITEELDRLRAHVTAARELLAQGGAVGRKLDFLMQEFNREANTLCSKSGYADLTRVGLALKAVIDQMREQVQNVE